MRRRGDTVMRKGTLLALGLIGGVLVGIIGSCIIEIIKIFVEEEEND